MVRRMNAFHVAWCSSSVCCALYAILDDPLGYVPLHLGAVEIAHAGAWHKTVYTGQESLVPGLVLHNYNIISPVDHSRWGAP